MKHGPGKMIRGIFKRERKRGAEKGLPPIGAFP